ncbi:MAG: flagellar hook-associated protein FlgL [Acidobacteria bacterium]|jgi:flagellar hook-associated protein 3 FlgL|nr:flagellar hook-associated protein FlgL [Acidobacteriota bacterium]
MRVTFNMAFRNGVYDINRAADAMARAQREVSSLKRVQRPSDDPSAASQVVAERTEQRQLDSFIDATASVDARLRVADSVLSDTLNLLTTAQTKTAAANNSYVTQQQRDALALEIEGIRDTLLSNVNTQVKGAYIFSGTDLTDQPYTKDGLGVVQAYAGNSSNQILDIDRNRAVAVTFDGDALVDTLFADLDALVTAIRSGDGAGMQAGMQQLQAAFERATAMQSRVGNDLSDLDEQQLRLDQMKRASETRRSGLEDANLAEAITNMSQAETAHSAALKAVAAANRPSLLDYLS